MSSSTGIRKLFFSLTAPFLLFVLIPVLVLNVVSSRAIRITEASESQACVDRLVDGHGSIDTILKNTNTILPLLQFDNTLLGLERLHAPLTATDQYDIWRGLQTVRAMDLSTREMTHIIYYPDADMIVSNAFVNVGIESLYGQLYQFGDLSYDAFRAAYQVEKNQATFFPYAHYTWNGQSYQGFLYGMKLRPGGTALLLFLIHESSIHSAFEALYDSGATLYIYSTDGALLYGPEDTAYRGELPHVPFGDSGLMDEDIFGGDTIASYSRSPYGLYFVSTLSKQEALAQVQALRYLTLYLTLGAIALTTLYALFLAAKSSKSIAQSLLLLSENPDLSSYSGGDAFNYLNSAMLELVSSNTVLRQDAQTRMGILRAAFVDKLVSGSFEDDAELDSFAQDAGLTLSGKQFFVVFITLDAAQLERQPQVRQRILDALQPFETSGQGILYSRTSNRIALFFLMDASDTPAFRETAQELLLETVQPICDAASMAVRYVGSGLCQQVSELSEAYLQCREHAAALGSLTDSGIQWIDRLPIPRQHLFVYPAEVEKRLINQLQSGDLPGTLDTLVPLFDANTRPGVLGDGMRVIFYTLLKGTYLKALDGELIELFRDRIEHLPLKRPAADVRRYFLDLTEDMCTAFTKAKPQETGTIRKEELLAYVEENFSDPSLSLSLASEHFGFSGAYFSQLFKDTTGENFSAFLERTRLEHSRVLLARSLKIDDVALQCGYSSTGTYRRAYKRYYGISPSQARALDAEGTP